MIPELPPNEGTKAQRSLLQELLALLADAGFIIDLAYLAHLDLGELIEDIIKLLEHHPLPLPPDPPSPPDPPAPPHPEPHPHPHPRPWPWRFFFPQEDIVPPND
jgi:hypothetical protein